MASETLAAADRARAAFFDLVTDATSVLTADEVLLANVEGETSDFMRLNRGSVRQAGTVEQATLSLELIAGARHVSGRIGLSGDPAVDRVHARRVVEQLRAQRAVVPDDPHLLYDESPWSDDRVLTAALPSSEAVLATVRDGVGPLDLVGLWAAGAVHRGFASSLGHRCWHTAASFHLDFSVYLTGDLAVKSSYAGTEWRDATLIEHLQEADRQLDVLARPAVTLKPGRYDAYLAPAALAEIVELLGWGGFGCRAHRTKSTPLIRMSEEGVRLARGVTMREHTAAGVAPRFQGQGFRRPDAVDLIRDGGLCDTLVSPRSSREFGVPTNGAGGGETPESIDVAAGSIARAGVAKQLGKGIWLGNLHYLNYSDRRHCRTTGMTRFACFWVEGGEIVGPLRPLRFDETVYRLLGDQLRGLTREREMLLAPDTYGGRSTTSAHLPGALVAEMTFTL